MEDETKLLNPPGTEEPPNTPANPSSRQDKSDESLRLVVQRFRGASILVDGEVVTVGESCGLTDAPVDATSCGIVVYVSFASAATTEKVLLAAKTILNLPLLTLGGWGDGSDTKSVLQMATSQSTPNVLLVPQANLVSKIKGQGKSIQYHGQIDKEVGKCLYHQFVDMTRALVLQHQYQSQNQCVPKWITSVLETKKTIDPSLPPQDMFRDLTLYSAWDSDGIPTADVRGGELTRSAIKKIKKQYESQKKRFEKYVNSAESKRQDEVVTKDWSLLDPQFCTIVAGTFGARQALEMSSDMGPFCHVVNI